MDLINPIVRRWMEDAAADPGAFWARAAEQSPWFRKWDRAFSWDFPNLVLNAPAWDWLQNRVLGGRVPVIDHMWQTETAGPVFGNPYGIAMLPIKPGSAAIPLHEARQAWSQMSADIAEQRR